MKLIYLPVLFFLFPISLNSQNNYECNVPYTPSNSLTLNLRSTNVNCEFLNLTNDEYNQIPIISIPVVFHFIPDNTGDNFICNPPVWSHLDAGWMANRLIEVANEDVFEMPSQDNMGGNTVPDTRIRLVLANVQTNSQCNGIWIYNNK